ncbi:hypothetical protein AB0C69_15860 [Actinomadura sp. NPDC048032]|uniref:hypothetical protein n=1 Tax=Actinomadura sp. NPDC048032 TaxID=3155747 RepID=UPI00340D24B0
MSAIVFAVISGLVINECSDLSPWLADKLVRWSARLRCDDPAAAEALGEELAAFVNERPGKLLKLLTSVGFVGTGLARRIDRRRPVESFTGQPLTWGDHLQGFCLATSLSCVVMVSHGVLAIAIWLAAFNAIALVSNRIKKFQARGQVSKLQRPYDLGLVFFLVPGTYIWCFIVTILTTMNIATGHHSWLSWLGLLANVMLLQAPFSWRIMVRAGAQTNRLQSGNAPESHT